MDIRRKESSHYTTRAATFKNACKIMILPGEKQGLLPLVSTNIQIGTSSIGFLFALEPGAASTTVCDEPPFIELPRFPVHFGHRLQFFV
jgi:hypothetical protein